MTTYAISIDVVRNQAIEKFNQVWNQKALLVPSLNYSGFTFRSRESGFFSAIFGALFSAFIAEERENMGLGNGLTNPAYNLYQETFTASNGLLDFYANPPPYDQVMEAIMPPLPANFNFLAEQQSLFNTLLAIFQKLKEVSVEKFQEFLLKQKIALGSIINALLLPRNNWALLDGKNRAISLLAFLNAPVTPVVVPVIKTLPDGTKVVVNIIEPLD